MTLTFETVDEKIAEAEFFLRRLCETGDLKEFNWYFSAFLSASRTCTLALQRFDGTIPGFAQWYEPHKTRLACNQLAKSFLDLRNDHVHGGPYPISGSMSNGNTVKFYFHANDPHQPTPTKVHVAEASRQYFVQLLEIVHDCYVRLGVHFDPQQYFTKEHYPGGCIAVAEIQIWGWIRTSLTEEGFTDDDRWDELRGKLAECRINHLFRAYLDKITPQPIVPDHYADFEFSEEDKGWDHIPAGFSSIGEYRKSFKRTLNTDPRGPKPKRPKKRGRPQ